MIVNLSLVFVPSSNLWLSKSSFEGSKAAFDHCLRTSCLHTATTEIDAACLLTTFVDFGLGTFWVSAVSQIEKIK